MFFCWIKNFFKYFFISAPENVYSDTNIPILRGLEAVILTRIHVDLVGQFVQRPLLESVKYFFIYIYINVFKNTFF